MGRTHRGLDARPPPPTSLAVLPLADYLVRACTAAHIVSRSHLSAKLTEGHTDRQWARSDISSETVELDYAATEEGPAQRQAVQQNRRRTK